MTGFRPAGNRETGCDMGAGEMAGRTMLAGEDVVEPRSESAEACNSDKKEQFKTDQSIAAAAG